MAWTRISKAPGAPGIRHSPNNLKSAFALFDLLETQHILEIESNARLTLLPSGQGGLLSTLLIASPTQVASGLANREICASINSRMTAFRKVHSVYATILRPVSTALSVERVVPKRFPGK